MRVRRLRWRPIGCSIRAPRLAAHHQRQVFASISRAASCATSAYAPRVFAPDQQPAGLLVEPVYQPARGNARERRIVRQHNAFWQRVLAVARPGCTTSPAACEHQQLAILVHDVQRSASAPTRSSAAKRASTTICSPPATRSRARTARPPSRTAPSRYPALQSAPASTAQRGGQRLVQAQPGRRRRQLEAVGLELGWHRTGQLYWVEQTIQSPRVLLEFTTHCGPRSLAAAGRDVIASLTLLAAALRKPRRKTVTAEQLYTTAHKSVDQQRFPVCHQAIRDADLTLPVHQPGAPARLDLIYCYYARARKKPRSTRPTSSCARTRRTRAWTTPGT